jgi:hypothetical protein
MKKVCAASIVAVCVFFLLSACTKQTENYTSATISDYFPMQVGRTFLYRLDSTIPAAFGSSLIVKYYQAKDSIESTFADNQGRTSYRIFRYTRDTLATKPWQFAATYYATNTGKSLEYVDNNLRFIKLSLPIKEEFSWPAHTYIDTRSQNTTVSYLDSWNYQYQNVDEGYSVLNKTYDTTITILQKDETLPEGQFNPTFPRQDRNYGVEVYAKGVGLIYKEFLHWTWQLAPTPSFESTSFGVKLQLISYK